jgi:hypothetical protein
MLEGSHMATIGKLERIFNRLEQIPPIIIASIALFVGVLLIFASRGAHASSFLINNKRVGYWYEINWSLNFVLIIPIATYFAANTCSLLRELVESLASSAMLVDANGERLEQERAVGLWHEFAKKALVVALVLSVVALIASWVECYYNLYVATGSPQAIGQPGGPLAGWNFAAVLGGAPPWALAIFGFAAYTAQGFCAAVFLTFVTLMLAFAGWIFTFTSPATKEELLPDFESNDTRLGFERFEPLVTNMLLAACFFFATFFLTRLDNAFVLSTHTSIFDFAGKDLGSGFFSHGDKPDIPHGVMELPNDEVRYPLMATGTALGVTIFVAFMVPSFILLRSAQSSRERAKARMTALDLPARTGLSAKQLEDRLDNMTFWPLKYPTPSELILFLILGAACFIYYSLTLFLVGVVLLRSALLFLGVAARTKK